jgi:hypothetical protein
MIYIPYIQSKASRDVNPAFVKLMLHCDGADGSTTLTDSSVSPVTLSAFNSAQIDIDQSVYGGASAYFPTSAARWQFTTPTKLVIGTDDFTIQCWVRMGTTGVFRHVCQFGDSSANGGFTINISAAGRLEFDTFLSSAISLGANAAVNQNVWKHIEICRSGNLIYGFIDGILLDASAASRVCADALNTDTTKTIMLGSDTYGWVGHIDDFRVLIGKAHHTNSFVPPSVPYLPA